MLDHRLDACAGGFLQLEHVYKGYREGERQRSVLVDLCAHAKKGEFIAIVGKSGSGKTTLLNLIGGIDRTDAGRITLNGIEITGGSDDQRTLYRRRHIGFVFQFFNLFPTMTIWENLTIPLELNGQFDQDGVERAGELLAEIGLADRKQAYPDQLSGGEQQRVAIARAVVHQPLLVLADEPTGNLDDDNGKIILALLDRLTRKAGNNLVMVTHSLEAAQFADRVYTLVEGKLEPIKD
ncbi:MAG: ABC transporter ATP-binding protein [Anaerolineae bacterium]|nr:ABC transporter ATP-binding protein [Anaerolineae bacterium]